MSLVKVPTSSHAANIERTANISSLFEPNGMYTLLRTIGVPSIHGMESFCFIEDIRVISLSGILSPSSVVFALVFVSERQSAGVLKRDLSSLRT